MTVSFFFFKKEIMVAGNKDFMRLRLLSKPIQKV